MAQMTTVGKIATYGSIALGALMAFGSAYQVIVAHSASARVGFSIGIIVGSYVIVNGILLIRKVAALAEPQATPPPPPPSAPVSQ